MTGGTVVASVDSYGRTTTIQQLNLVPLPQVALPEQRASIVPMTNGNFRLLDEEGTCWGIAGSAETLTPAKRLLEGKL